MAKFRTNANGILFYLAGEITQVIDSIPWVRCASGNVLAIIPGSGLGWEGMMGAQKRMSRFKFKMQQYPYVLDFFIYFYGRIEENELI